MIVYLHGLNSSSQSEKAALLREALAPEEVLAPDYPAHRPDEAMAALMAQMRTFADKGNAPILVGSSMGAFYGQSLARHFPVTHLFMINPALRPWELLSDFLGVPMATARGEEYRLDEDTINATRAYGIEQPCDGDDDGVPTTLFLDRGDEVFDYRVAEALYRDCGRLLLYAGGDHAFQHMEHAVGVIRDTLHGRDDAAQP
ncbi:MAG: YqiA/YcfP family alpha/beta fold hydrolase [Thiohalocapsa sp.]